MNDLLWASSPSFFDLQFQLQQQPWQQQHPHHHRALQFVLPVYTSPPLPDAIEATPEEYRDDVVIDTMRALDAAGLCSAFNCHMAFLGDDDDDKKNNETVADVGILFYGGALVDPRSYSVWITTLASQGFPVVVPVFASDVAFGCGSGRLEMAKEAYPDVVRWLLVGHSFGGVGAASDAWFYLQEQGGDYDDTAVAGVVLLANYLEPSACGPAFNIDFSKTDLPMRAIYASNDLIVTQTEVEENEIYLSKNTVLVAIEGGNHGQFGSYNDTLRTPILGQIDGEATITPQEQWDSTLAAILEVLEMVTMTTAAPATSNSAWNHHPLTTTAAAMIGALLLLLL